MRVAKKTTSIVLLLLAGAWSAAAVADPPRHAPAHGWRKQHDPFYVGYSGRHWEHDFEILSGRCNREAVATVLGGVVGAVVGSRVAEPENRTVATIIGAAAGALIGNRIGHELDQADRSCVGHALEVGRTGQRIVWTNESIGVNYEVALGRDRTREGTACREFTLLAAEGSKKSSQRGIACQSQPGVWQIEELKTARGNHYAMTL
jgi:surface antigen